MTRCEIIQRLVLNSICDDWENIDQMVLRQVQSDGARCGLDIQRADIVEALTSLVRDGLAQAEPGGMPSVDEPEEDFRTYFYITDQGMDFHLSDDPAFPFDDQDKLRPGWTLESLES